MESQCRQGGPALAGADAWTTPFHWLDVQRIGEELAEAHPEADPLTVTFPGTPINGSGP